MPAMVCGCQACASGVSVNKKTATRAASGEFLNQLADVIPWLVGGSADLAPSNNTALPSYPSVTAGRSGILNSGLCGISGR